MPHKLEIGIGHADGSLSSNTDLTFQKLTIGQSSEWIILLFWVFVLYWALDSGDYLNTLALVFLILYCFRIASQSDKGPARKDKVSLMKNCWSIFFLITSFKATDDLIVDLTTWAPLWCAKSMVSVLLWCPFSFWISEGVFLCSEA